MPAVNSTALLALLVVIACLESAFRSHNCLFSAAVFAVLGQTEQALRFKTTNNQETCTYSMTYGEVEL